MHNRCTVKWPFQHYCTRCIVMRPALATPNPKCWSAHSGAEGWRPCHAPMSIDGIRDIRWYSRRRANRRGHHSAMHRCNPRRRHANRTVHVVNAAFPCENKNFSLISRVSSISRDFKRLFWRLGPFLITYLQILQY